MADPRDPGPWHGTGALLQRIAATTQGSLKEVTFVEALGESAAPAAGSVLGRLEAIESALSGSDDVGAAELAENSNLLLVLILQELRGMRRELSAMVGD